MASTGTTQRQQASPPAGEKQPDGEPLPQANPLAALESGFWVLAILLTLVAVYFICMTPLAIADFWWQAKAGELIVKQGRVPTRDPFSWTAQGQPWLVHEWLPDVFFYLAYSNRLQWLLLFYKSGMAALACGLVIARTWTRTRSIPLGIAAALLTASVMRNFTDIRPQMVTFVLLAALLLALDEYRVGRLARLPWMLPVLFALWANLHGGVVVGLLIVLIWAAGEAVGKWLFGQDSHGLVPLSVSLAAACVAVGLNPNGFHVYTYPLQVLGHPAVTDYIREWFSPDFHGAYMRPFEIMLLGTLGILALTRVRHYGELLVLLAMAHAALISQRNTIPYAVAAGPALAAGVYFLLQESPALGRLRDWACRPWVRTIGAAAAACALAALIYQCVPRIPPGAWFDELALTASFPRHSTRLLGQGYWPGRLYNDYMWGGYLIWHLYPSRPVFVDGRAEVYYPTGAFDDEMAIHRTSPGWQEILDRRRVEVILTDRWGDLARGLVHAPQWRLAFTGEVEVVYVRTHVRTQAPRSWSRPRRSQESTQCTAPSPPDADR